jgi:hypothetical protein
MKTIKNSKDITTLEVGDKVISRELAKQFLNNFKDLLEVAKPLL